MKAILVNIFGGIMRCDTIAEGVIAACKAVNLSVPLVVRMKGTNEDLGKKMLADSGLPIISADTMAEAAQKVDGRRQALTRRTEHIMSILIDKDTKVITQGITGKTGQFHTRDVPRLRQRQELLRRRREPEEGRRGLRRHPDLRQRQGSQGRAPAPPSA